MCIWVRQRLPQFPGTPCRLTDEDDDGENLGPVQPPHTIQPQREHTMNPLLQILAEDVHMGGEDMKYVVVMMMMVLYKPSSSLSQHFSECSSGWFPVQTPPGFQPSAAELHVHWGLTPLCSTETNGFISHISSTSNKKKDT